SCSASNHADTWPGRSVSGLLSMASHKRLNSCAACSRVTTSHPLVLSFPLVSTGQNHRDGVVVRRMRIRAVTRLEVGGSPQSLVVHVADDAEQVVVDGAVDSPGFSGRGGTLYGLDEHRRLHVLLFVPPAQLVHSERAKDANALAVMLIDQIQRIL